jgi:hypothetical protein
MLKKISILNLTIKEFLFEYIYHSIFRKFTRVKLLKK